MKNLSSSIDACIANGRRLLEDSDHLLGIQSYPTAKALSILAQEEFAKAYILKLVIEGAIPWSESVLKATKDHACKQLMGMVMEDLFIPWETLESYPRDEGEIILSAKIADALNMICHTKILGNDIESEDYKFSGEAKKVLNGQKDKRKQNSIYVCLSKNGSIKSIPSSTEKDVMQEIEYAKILEEVASGHDAFAFRKKQYIIDVLKLIFKIQ